MAEVIIGSQNFSLGWITTVPAHLVDEGGTPNVQNVDFSESFGRLTKRKGHSVHTTSRTGGTDRICGLYEFVTSAGASHIVAASIDDIYVLTSGTTWTSFHTDASMDGTNVSFTTFNDLLIFVGQELTTSKWTGSGASAALGGTPPSNGKWIESHKRRVFIANTSAGASRLHFCALDNPEDWTTANDAGFIDVGKGDGDVITGLASLGTVLLIFKKRSTWALFGNAPSNYTIRQLSPSIGCVNGKTVVKCDKFAIFLSQDGVYSCNSDGVVLLSYNIKPTIDAITDTARGIACAGRLRTQYWLAVDTDADGDNDEVYVLDYVYGNWGRYTNKKINVMAKLYNNTLITGGSDTDVIMLQDDTDNDNGSAINMIWDTKDYDGDDWTAIKHPYDLKLVAEPITAKTLTLTHLVDGVASATTLPFTLTGVGSRDKVYFTGRHLPSASYGGYFRYRFSNNETSARVKLLGYSSKIIVSPRRS